MRRPAAPRYRRIRYPLNDLFVAFPDLPKARHPNVSLARDMPRAIRGGRVVLRGAMTPSAPRPLFAAPPTRRALGVIRVPPPPGRRIG